MQVIRTRSLATTLRRMFLGFVVFMVLLIAAAAAIAKETPPQPLLDKINEHELVYSKKCDVKSLNVTGVECLIFYDRPRDTIWVVLFDDNIDITRIFSASNKKETHVWCRRDVCI